LKGNECRCQNAIESHREASNEITGFSQRISAIERGGVRLVQWDVDAEWNEDSGCERGDRSHIRPALPNHKSISDSGINYQTKAAVAH